MKQKLLYLLPLFLLSGCGQATYKNASLPAEERAGLLLKGTDARREGVLDDGQLQTSGTPGHQAL